MLSVLRPRQTTAINQIRQSLASAHERPMLQACTGFGKTTVAAAIAEGALKKNKRLMFTVPAISLIDQTIECFTKEGINDIGIIQANHPLTDPRKPIQIASVQTLCRRNIPHADVVLVDEAHIWYRFYQKWMKEWDATPFIGLSATPWAKGLGKHYDDLLIPSTIQEEIEAGHLSDFIAYAPDHPDLTGVRTLAGDYHEGDLSEAMQRGKLTADIVQNWLEKADQQPTLVFAVDRAHAKQIQKQFITVGVNAGYIDAYTDLDQRKIIKKQFHDGAMPVVVNVACLILGLDWDVRCIVLARPTRSEMLLVQMIGRGLRKAYGKEYCLIFDHSDSLLRLGLPTDIHHSVLNTGIKNQALSAKEKSTPLPTECAKCKFIKPPKIHECPSCGFKPEKQSKIEVEDGNLIQLDRNKLRFTRAEKEYFYGELLYLANKYGYNDGWAAWRFKEVMGQWPNRLDKVLIPPTQGTLNYVKHWQIKSAKQKAAQKKYG